MGRQSSRPARTCAWTSYSWNEPTGKTEIPYPFDYHIIDLATLFYAWSLVTGEQAKSLSLRQAATEAGLLHGRKVEHRALSDARLTLETFRHYIGRLAPRELAEVVPSEEAVSQTE